MANKIILVEEKIFDELVNRIDILTKQVDLMHKKYKSKKLGEQLDATQVCNILNIKNRTL